MTSRARNERRRDEDFAAFVRRDSARLLHIAELTTGDPHRAQDLVQSALLGTYKHWNSIDGEPFAYARRSVVNGHLTWWRRFTRESLRAEPPDASEPDRTSAVDSRHVLNEALRRLTARERAVLVLRFTVDLSEERTALELGIARGTVKSTTSRALAKLRAALSELEATYVARP